jgi:ubiquinone/menaquinone biosynthesis C-methylase UbiE
MNNDLLFNSESHLYADIRPTYPAELFQYIKQHSAQHHCAWDCATGNGQAAMDLATLFNQVEATDVSTNQISHAFQRDNIHYSVQRAEKTTFADQSFDTICVAQALHWFDFDVFWPEVKRLLTDNGLFIAFSYSWSEVTPEVDDIINDIWREAILPYWAKNNQHCWEGYRRIDFPFKKLPVPNMTMVQQWNAIEYMNYLRSWSASRLYLEKNGDELFSRLCRSVADAWKTPQEKKSVSFPLTVIAGHRWQ